MMVDGKWMMEMVIDHCDLVLGLWFLFIVNCSLFIVYCIFFNSILPK